MFMQIALQRMLIQLHQQELFHITVLAWLRQYGFPPHDPLVIEFEGGLRHIKGAIETVNDAKLRFAPFRPLESSRKNSGLASHIKPDFAARGIERSGEQIRSPQNWWKKDD